jgi:mannosylglycoprotein endo-beta-mannosidase
LSSCDKPFTEEEIWQAIYLMPWNKAPRPDGFTGLFFRQCWPIIRHDIVTALNSVYNLRYHDLNLINKSNMILLPQKEGAENI